MILQKLEFMRTAARLERGIDVENKTSVCSQWRWYIGFTLFIFGQLFNAVALSFASQSMLATLGAFSLVSNTLFAPFLLGEKVYWTHLVSVCLIVVGAVTVVLNSNHAEHNFDVQQLVALYKRPAFIGLLSFTAISVFLTLVRRYVAMRKGETLPGHLYAYLAAVFGSLSVLFSKSISQLIKQTAMGNNQFKSPVTYFIIVMTVVCGVLSIRALNEGLQSSAKALFLIPFYFVLVLIGQVGCGASYFGDFDSMGTAQTIFVCGGVTLTIVGVWISSMHDVKNDEVLKVVTNDEDAPGIETPVSFVGNDIDENRDNAKPLPRIRASTYGTTRSSGTLKRRSIVRRASVKRFSLHREAYSESFTPILPELEETNQTVTGNTGRDSTETSAQSMNERLISVQTTPKKRSKRRYSVSVIGGLGVC
jgi:drug/metabolite transporter (DMT)-like permease